MNKLTIPLTIVSVNLAAAGSVFKMLHWPAANILLCAGLILIALVLIPMVLWSNFTITRTYPTLHLITGFVFTLGVLAILFKTMHWQYANLLLQVSFPLPFLVFLPVYLYSTRMEERSNDYRFTSLLLGLTVIAVVGIFISF